jgi:hypothetical protein
MAIHTTQPVSVSHPEIPYSDLLISLSIAPIIKGGVVEGAVSMTAHPYRIVDGVVEKAGDQHTKHFSTGKLFQDAATDPALADAANAIFGAIAAFVAAKGM